MDFGFSKTLLVVVLIRRYLVRFLFRSFRVSLSLPLPLSACTFLFHGYRRRRLLPFLCVRLVSEVEDCDTSLSFGPWNLVY